MSDTVVTPLNGQTEAALAFLGEALRAAQGEASATLLSAALEQAAGLAMLNAAAAQQADNVIADAAMALVMKGLLAMSGRPVAAP
ncbi:MAG: hypothetical protein ACREHE_17405 [Rhizomicrobium sp.]